MFQLSSISKGLILSTCKREHAWEIGLLRPAKRSRKNFPDVVKAKVPGGGEIGIGTLSSVPKSTGTWMGDLGAGVESQVLEPWLMAPCFWPHGLPPTLTAHRCANLHVLLLQVPRWYLWHSVFLLPSTTMKVHKSWLPWRSPWTLGGVRSLFFHSCCLTLLGFLGDGVTLGAGEWTRGRGWSKPYMSALAAVNSWRASFKDHFWVSIVVISFHNALSASSISARFTLLREESAGCRFKAREKNFSSNFLKIWRWAALHITKALRKTCWVLRSHSADSFMDSIGISGVSSSKAPNSWASERIALCVLASVISWYCFCDIRSCQGMYLIDWPGFKKWCTIESNRMDGVESEVRSSPG